ncbi:MAG: hypothetical protein H0V39_08540 [Nitrosomonas sp.]|nr:hypothetical protein [Nitrosomonas sp.]
MNEEPLIRLTWQGQKTVESIPKLLNEAEQIEVTLPMDYNHALFRTLNPDVSVAELEKIDVSGGPELLNRIAAVRGLEELAALAERLNVANISVRIISPPKLILSSKVQ